MPCCTLGSRSSARVHDGATALEVAMVDDELDALLAEQGAYSRARPVSHRRYRRGTSATERREWLTPGVRGIGGASLLADVGHEVSTALLVGGYTTTAVLAPRLAVGTQ